MPQRAVLLQNYSSFLFCQSNQPCSHIPLAILKTAWQAAVPADSAAAGLFPTQNPGWNQKQFKMHVKRGWSLKLLDHSFHPAPPRRRYYTPLPAGQWNLVSLICLPLTRLQHWLAYGTDFYESGIMQTFYPASIPQPYIIICGSSRV